MECKNCGKQLDVRSEKKFCTGCGAPIGEAQPPPKIITRERAEGPKWITTRREAELDLRTRVFMLAAIAGFLLFFLIFQFIFTVVIFNFLLALLSGFLVGAVGIFIISRGGDDMRNSIGESIDAMPVIKPVRGLVESLCSTIPLLGSLPHDNAGQPNKNNDGQSR